MFLDYAKEFPGVNLEQYEKMCTLIKENPKLYISNDLMKLNKAIAYLSFFLKDVFEYANSKGPDGTNITFVRNAIAEQTKLVEEMQKIVDAIGSNS